MQASILDRDIKFLPGVGPARAELLKKELVINTLGDLLYFFPYKHVDRTKFYNISEVSGNLPYIRVEGKITGRDIYGAGRNKRLTAHLSDGTGSLELIWFRGFRWINDLVVPGKKFIVFGKPNLFNGKINIVHPELEDPEKQEKMILSSMQSFYSTTEKLKNSFITSRVIQKFQHSLLKLVNGSIDETLPAAMIERLKLPALEKALLDIHFPQNPALLKKAEQRLKFEELFYLQLGILYKRSGRYQRVRGLQFSIIGDLVNDFYNNHLPFELTQAQKRVLREIRKDTGSGRQMNRLLQGDVGSGKTLVAVMSMLIAADNGFQACLMAPTEILASQHFTTISKLLCNLPVKQRFLPDQQKKATAKLFTSS
jgi:ATP-dependent DNA helicase RecG